VQTPWLEPEALNRAWNRVRENDGCAGADGVTIQRFSCLLDAEWEELKQSVEHGQYRALPLLPIVITKHPGSTETRTLMFPLSVIGFSKPPSVFIWVQSSRMSSSTAVLPIAPIALSTPPSHAFASFMRMAINSQHPPISPPS